MNKEDKINLIGIIFLGIMSMGMLPLVWFVSYGKDWKSWLNKFNQ